MQVYHFPKGKHVRTLTGYRYKKYRSYKRVLQHEFSRTCVYCRAPDSFSPVLYYAYSVDHYRPKSLRRFASLANDYVNLFYCCSQCNSRKNDYWPADEKAGPYIPNPCEHDMGAHLRFNSKNGKVEAKTAWGLHAIDLLQLNDDATVQSRLNTINLIEMAELKVRQCEQRVRIATTQRNAGKIDQAAYEVVVTKLREQQEEAKICIATLNGSLKSRPLPRLRNSP